MLKVALANIHFINIFRFQEFFHTALEFPFDVFIPVRPVVKEPFEPIPKFRILLKILLQGNPIRVVPDNDNVPVIETVLPEITKQKKHAEPPAENAQNKKGIKGQKVIPWNKIGLRGYNVDRDEENMV